MKNNDSALEENAVMKEANIFKIKQDLGRESVRLAPEFFKQFSINEICDDILSNYIAYCLYSSVREGGVENFLTFLKERGNLEVKHFEFVENTRPILELPTKIDLYTLIRDPYMLARTYERMKSCVVRVVNGEIVSYESLDYRKSSGMFFTPKEIVKFIIGNTFKNKKKDIEDLIEKGEAEEAVRKLLELKLVDIACGTGSFLTEAIYVLKEIRCEILHQFGEKSLKKINNGKLVTDDREFSNHILRNSIFGVDIDKNAALLCAYNIWRTCFAGMEAMHIFRKQIRVGNSLTGNVASRREIMEDKPTLREMWHIEDDKYSNRDKNGFNWPLEFPEVFSRDNPGFDIIVMNPPYGKVRLESHKGHNKNNEIKKQEREKMKNIANFFRKSVLYELSTYGVLNFYKLMIERAFALLRNGGSLGFIVPNTLLCDKSTAKIRRHLFDSMDTEVIVNIPEHSDFFGDVTQSFCIVISSFPGVSKKIKFKGIVKTENELKNNNFIDINVDFIREKFPEMLYIPITDRGGYKIFSKIHNSRKLSDYRHIKNSRGEVDLTKYSKIISSDNRLKRLIRGNNIEKYRVNDDVRTKPSFIDESELRKELGSSPKLMDISKERLVCKQIANQNKRVRLDFAIVPPYTILGNSCNYLSLQDSEDQTTLRYLFGFLNSSIVEWRFRVTSTNNHINNYEIDDFPLIMPEKKGIKWEVFKKIANCAEEIRCSENSNERILLESRIDWLVFKLFDMSIDEMIYVVSAIGKDDNYIQLIREYANVG